MDERDYSSGRSKEDGLCEVCVGPDSHGAPLYVLRNKLKDATTAADGRRVSPGMWWSERNSDMIRRYRMV